WAAGFSAITRNLFSSIACPCWPDDCVPAGIEEPGGGGYAEERQGHPEAGARDDRRGAAAGHRGGAEGRVPGRAVGGRGRPGVVPWGGGAGGAGDVTGRGFSGGTGGTVALFGVSGWLDGQGDHDHALLVRGTCRGQRLKSIQLM